MDSLVCFVYTFPVFEEMGPERSFWEMYMIVNTKN